MKMGQISKIANDHPGVSLVILGFVTIYVVVGLRGDSEPGLMTYLVIGFGFFLSLSGIVLLFKESSRSLDTDADLGLSPGSSDIEHTVIQLGKNYDILRKQAIQGFMLAGTFMALGILVILAGSLGEMFGFSKTAGNLTTVAGIIVEVVSGLGLYLFKETFKQLNSTSDRLYEMWKILAAFKKADTLPDDKRSEVVVALINRLVAVPSENIAK